MVSSILAPKRRVFVARRIPELGMAKLQSGCEVDLWTGDLPPSRQELLQRIRGVDGVLSLLTDRIDAEAMDAAGRLKVISNFAVGVNNIDLAAAAERGIKVGNTPGVLTEATADIAFALLMAAARKVVQSDAYARSGKWKTWEPLGHIGLDLIGKTVGIVGMGRIGTAFARRCRFGWNMRVLYCSRTTKAHAEKDLVARKVDFDALLAESDIVSVHTDLNDETRRLFNAAAFAKMKPTAIFINTARGAIHDQPALVAALKANAIFAAGLDVTDPEPPDPADELLRLENLVVLPHIASATVSTRNAMADIAADNLLLGLQGLPLRHAVA